MTELDLARAVTLRAERESRRLYVVLALLIVAVVAAGTFGFLSLHRLTSSNHDVLTRVRQEQVNTERARDAEVARLEAELRYYQNTAIPAMTDYIQHLARELRARGGDPGTFVIQPPPSPTPSP